MRSVLVISQRDNVATALEPLEPGRRLDVDGRSVAVRDPIPSGHKIALAHIPAGEAVVKYGSPIGIASAEIRPGEHVHTHNVSSVRGRGDLPAAVEPEPRLAEPPDDRSSANREADPGGLEGRRAAQPGSET